MVKAFVVALAAVVGTGLAFADDKPIRAGIIGVDTSHSIAFTKAFQDPKATADVKRVKLVAAFPGGSADIPSSADRIEPNTKAMKELGVEIVDSIPALLERVDVVLLESVDGRPHLEQVRPVFAAGKPVFIDKPLGGTLADAIAIDELGRKSGTPWFSSSSLRFGPKLQAAIKDAKAGEIVGCDAWSPCHLEPHHPDLYWYGVHGVETLYTVMGTGCQSVTRVDGAGENIVVTGVWDKGRVGVFRGYEKNYGAVIFGSKSVTPVVGFEGYQPLVEQIATFFVTRKEPVRHEETLEIMAFMEAADESKRQGGKPVTLESVMRKAREGAAGK